MDKLGDDISPEITAEWARNKGQNIVSTKVTLEVRECLDAVDNAVNRDDKSAQVSGSLHDKTIVILRGRGFKVEYTAGYDQRDPAYHTITW